MVGVLVTLVFQSHLSVECGRTCEDLSFSTINLRSVILDFRIVGLLAYGGLSCPTMTSLLFDRSPTVMRYFIVYQAS